VKPAAIEDLAVMIVDEEDLRKTTKRLITNMERKEVSRVYQVDRAETAFSVTDAY